MKTINRLIAFLIVVFASIGFAAPALAFCGFYVAKADATLYNQASQVVIARDKNRTILTMANDYQGAVKDFALVVPVPVVLKPEQVKIGEPKVIQQLDAFSAPRLVEYFDPDPCNSYPQAPLPTTRGGNVTLEMDKQRQARSGLGVTIEARFSVGEYDILILSAKESDGLETWLIQNGYQIPQGASALLKPYIQQGLKFFVAKVNLEKFDQSGFQTLRPLMIAYESPRFMLPIRLGMINGKGEQDLIVYLLSPKGQVELTNYRTVKIPSDQNIPEFVKEVFPGFYKSLFNTIHEREQKKVAFLEYAWNMGGCDPCSADPLTNEELKQAGVFWLDSPTGNSTFITRLHIRYARNTFPEDLNFQETANQQNFQGRYVINHPYRESMQCSQAQQYRQSVRQRQQLEAQNLATLTGWKIEDIRRRINWIESTSDSWWDRIWNKN
ncbi:DUF2330 domain-containing protein [Planktothrix paucivesiculata]|uniref:DUF2330 domain-containing protein n=1 Tax=Planktothrix paucivesiculata PCC 9631 TaxID=671071 RepID=A0A7Z9BVK3_9CYAN|nr:DUF2330 domain-containing protein [Planktothrix paucivesiculata]VXD22187.1 conserved hypothetical protein; putative signal peptide [Planktothrix paucivesiculata PCC 9631]